jgi:hypothetical protein
MIFLFEVENFSQNGTSLILNHCLLLSVFLFLSLSFSLHTHTDTHTLQPPPGKPEKESWA